jgi:asparagine synthase (glutamine-hydrolysing)
MCRLPQQGEAGAHLSGGLDSSSIAVLAARALCAKGRKLHSYSFLDRQRNDITLEDETDFVNAVLAQEDNITSTPIRPPHRSFEIQNDLYISSSLAADDPENSVCAHAESQDVHLILSGWGGDEAATFNGRGAMAELLIRGRIGTLARELRGLMRERNWSLRQVVYQEVTSYFIPDWLVDFKRRLTGKELSTRGSFRMAFSPLMRKRLRAEPGANISIGPDGRKNRYELMTSPHIAFRAEDWALRGARHGLAFAFPLLDRRVVEYALSLPSEMFIHGGFRRRPFREAMCDVLPDKLRLRHEKYQPFPGNAIDVAERRDEAMALLEKLEGNEDMRRLFDLKRLRRQLENFPSPEELRAGMVEGENPTPLPVMTAAMHTLHTASIFLNRMAGDDNRPPAPVQNS